MIICHCTVISCGDVRQAVGMLIAGNEVRNEAPCVNPNGVFRCCGKRPNCGSCLPLMRQVIAEALPLAAGSCAAPAK